MSANLDWRRIESALENYFRKMHWGLDRNKLSADVELNLIAEMDGTPIVELNLTLLAQDLAKELER
jgi:hypothetical protein